MHLNHASTVPHACIAVDINAHQSLATIALVENAGTLKFMKEIQASEGPELQSIGAPYNVSSTYMQFLLPPLVISPSLQTAVVDARQQQLHERREEPHLFRPVLRTAQPLLRGLGLRQAHFCQQQHIFLVVCCACGGYSTIILYHLVVRRW